MAGIYIHIPFCKKACHYCNFHFSTSLRLKDDMIDAICRELILQNKFLDGEIINTIYFGGGTPSILEPIEIDRILNTIHKYFHVETDIELTLEANPDDLDKKKILALQLSGVNRLSIGVQSFYDRDLEWMNRSHNSGQAHQVIRDAMESGVTNLNIDLIFGSPTTTNEMWENNLSMAMEYGIKHLSCYALTVEDKTALGHFVKTGKEVNPDEKAIQEQYDICRRFLSAKGFIHYEISNYALENHFAIHNTSYWKGLKYLGIGPSSHSFNGFNRYWNVSNNKKYIDSLAHDIVPVEKEKLSETDTFNEYLMTGLRTMWGCDETYVNEKLKTNKDLEHHLNNHLEAGHIKLRNGRYIMTEEAWLTSDSIIADLFIE
ncbi:MAG: radical SAM family heme chaperone HemW [Saprospiraceae bacterium]|nr:radical SAM family heme chaperone HemW [Bacteroidia bacterium]NNF22961.1 radical SAM family heme chaperone HemW [Saprospiraceae bacterium]